MAINIQYIIIYRLRGLCVCVCVCVCDEDEMTVRNGSFRQNPYPFCSVYSSSGRSSDSDRSHPDARFLSLSCT
jgi:hypothetical protein